MNCYICGTELDYEKFLSVDIIRRGERAPDTEFNICDDHRELVRYRVVRLLNTMREEYIQS